MVNCPRYVFRTYSPGSDGWNSPAGFDSMAKAKGISLATTLRDFERKEARAMLKDHVLWTSRRRRDNDILISFTSSFLFALQHAIRKSNVCFNTNRANCSIAIIDTSKFPDGTFSWTPTLLNEYELNETQDANLKHSNHEGEYLAQYELLLVEGDTSAVASLDALINLGNLCHALPGLDLDSRELVRALRDARRDWYQETKAIIRVEIDRARDLALCFGGKWFCPMLLWALAMRARSAHDQVLRQEFEDDWHGSLEQPFWGNDESCEPPESVREVREWVKITRAANHIRRLSKRSSIQTTQTEELSNLVDGLSSLQL